MPLVATRDIQDTVWDGVQRMAAARRAQAANERPDAFTLHPHQRPPEGDWDVWMLLGGRGSGKTVAGAYAAIQHLREVGPAARVGIGAPTRGDARDYCAEGATGLLTLFGSEFPTYNRSLLEARHERGGFVKFEGSERPERWNGPAWSFLWLDEFGLWKRDANKERDAFYQADFGLRLGAHPRMIVTTTAKRGRPLSLAQIKAWLKAAKEGDPKVAVSTATTFDNPDLAERVRLRLEEAYGGTTLGRQELYAEILEAVEGALWEAGWIDAARVDALPTETIGANGTEEQVTALARVVVAVDPAVSTNETSDQTGLAVAARGKRPCSACRAKGYTSDFYIMAAEGAWLSPKAWADRTVALYKAHEADRVIAEINNGGDLVKSNLRSSWSDAPISVIHASRGKEVRAEPVAALYEQGRVHHVGVFSDLEEQQCTFPIAHEHDDILDADVYAITELMERKRLRAV